MGLHAALYEPRWGEIRLHTPPSTDRGEEEIQDMGKRGGDPAPHAALYEPRWGEIRLHTPPSTNQGGERSGSTRRPLQTEVRRRSRA